MAGRQREIVVVLGVLALGLVGWGLCGTTSHPWRGTGAHPSRVSCGSYLLPRRLDNRNADAVVDHDAACRAPREHQAMPFVLAGLAVGALAAVVATGRGGHVAVTAPRAPGAIDLS
ncbi:hypothetical protein KSP35_22645 [Aquihabitans sp. G128]|uniref:hypothetical protein n=1 Tax=Aquihabitans sp. G128 TaxID=2849779 RepID=UPI001C2280CF|nr:hypothetical protein [Aquihabitans sp. G128]QXC61076.1 hypothetical protein KSP35_22645 [Aquihabitans sp. G128]